MLPFSLADKREPGDSDSYIRAKYFFRDLFLVSYKFHTQNRDLTKTTTKLCEAILKQHCYRWPSSSDTVAGLGNYRNHTQLVSTLITCMN